MLFKRSLNFHRISAAPTLPPSHVRVTLIEVDTALVSWKPPDQPSVAVTHYTVLYASRQAWIAGEWKVLQREGEGWEDKWNHTHKERFNPIIRGSVLGDL